MTQRFPTNQVRWYGLAVLLVLPVLFVLNSMTMPLDDRIDPNPGLAEIRSPVEVQSGDLSAEITRIRESGVWGTTSPDASVGESDTALPPSPGSPVDQESWKLVGLIVTNDGRQAVLLRGDGYIQTVLEGDMMPSGEQVVEWGKDYIVLRRNGDDTRLALYPDPS